MTIIESDWLLSEDFVMETRACVSSSARRILLSVIRSVGNVDLSIREHSKICEIELLHDGRRDTVKCMNY